MLYASNHGSTQINIICINEHFIFLILLILGTVIDSKRLFFCKTSGTMDGREYLEVIRSEKDLYPGFNLIVGDTEGLYLFSNRDPSESISKISNGSTVGLTNTLMTQRWFKSDHGVKLVKSLSTPDPDLLACLASDSDFRKTKSAPSEELQNLLSSTLNILADRNAPTYREDTIPYDKVGKLASIFVPVIDVSAHAEVPKEYGTRCSIAIFVDELDRITFYERSLDTDSKEWKDRVFHFTASPQQPENL